MDNTKILNCLRQVRNSIHLAKTNGPVEDSPFVHWESYDDFIEKTNAQLIELSKIAEQLRAEVAESDLDLTESVHDVYQLLFFCDTLEVKPSTRVLGMIDWQAIFEVDYILPLLDRLIERFFQRCSK